MSAYDEFAAYTGELNDLLCIGNTLHWDLQTQMPPNGTAMRGQQMATLARLIQERFTAPEMDRLLTAAEAAV